MLTGPGPITISEGYWDGQGSVIVKRYIISIRIEIRCLDLPQERTQA